MESFEQLFDVNGASAMDTFPTQNLPASIQIKSSGMHPATSFQPVNDWADDPTLFDISPNEKPNPFELENLPPPANPTIKLSSIEIGKQGLPKTKTDGLPRVRHQYGQITPPDETPELKPVTTNGNDPTLSRMNNQMAKNAFPLEAPSADDRQQIKAEPNEPSPKKRKRGRKAKNMDEGKQNPEEDAKREKFLERNRIAATKCRERKREWMNGLEAKARDLQTERNHLSAYVTSLRDELLYLRDEMLKHQNCGCTKIREYLNGQAETLSPSANLHQLMGNTHSIPNASANDMHRPDLSKSRASSIAFDSPQSATTDQELHSLLAASLPQNGQEYC